MAYVKVPKDLTDFKTKLALGLTSRQLVCWGSAGAIGIPTYLIINNYTGNIDLASWITLLLVAPLFAFSVVEKNGLPLEKFIGSFIRSRILSIPKRPYKVKNGYEILSTDWYLDDEEMEVSPVDHSKAKKRWRK